MRLAFLRSPWLCVGGLGTSVAAFSAAGFLLPINEAFVSVTVVMFAAAVAFAAVEPRRTRVVPFNLFVLALAARAIALTSLSWLAARQGGPFLGADSTGYLDGALDLAARGFHLGASPAAYFGTYDVSQYYLFAAAIRYLHADLFALQTLNAGLTALAAPLTYSIARRVVPRGARAIGLIIAVHPSLIALSVVDLLKDPSVVFATLLAIWTIVAIARAPRPAGVAGFVGPGLLGLLYLRTGRFYSFAYIEAAVVCAAVWIALRQRRRPFRTRAAFAGLLLVFMAGEGLPGAAGWPSSPVLFASQFAAVTGSPSLLAYWGGSIRGVGVGEGADESHAGLLFRLADLRGHLSGRDRAALVLSFGAGVVRRVLGPFPWVGPQRWNFRTLQTDGLLFYPGMLIWYAIMPLTMIGFVAVARDLLVGPRRRFGVAFLWLFTAVLFAQYLAINLSFRQREGLMPVLLLFAALGLKHAGGRPALNRWYRAYWLALVLLAIAHMSVRAWVS